MRRLTFQGLLMIMGVLLGIAVIGDADCSTRTLPKHVVMPTSSTSGLAMA